LAAADLDLGRVYPALTRIREVSVSIATAVAEVAYQRGLARRRRPADVRTLVTSLMCEPVYQSYVAADA